MCQRAIYFDIDFLPLNDEGKPWNHSEINIVTQEEQAQFCMIRRSSYAATSQLNLAENYLHNSSNYDQDNENY